MIAEGPINFIATSTKVSTTDLSLILVATEIWWLFAFLTAKEDADIVDSMISMGLFQVSSIIISLGCVTCYN